MSARGGDRAILESLFRAGVEAVDPAVAVRRAVHTSGDTLEIAGERVPPSARLVVLAAGKAAAAMAAALEACVGDRIAGGLAVTRDGHGVPLRRVTLREAAHPLPDARGERAAREALALAAGAHPDDVLVVALSGGASALLACPAAELRLSDLAKTTRALLESGAEIAEMNAVRKHLSAIGGGRLALAARCRRIVLLCISDVPGDALDLIGSGPCSPDPTTFGDALAVIERRGLRDAVPARVLSHLQCGARGERDETPKPGNAALERVRARILARNRDALDAVRAAAARHGLDGVVLAGALRGEARCAARRLAGLARSVRSQRSVCLVAGGETAVTVRGDGRGGRNQELALAAALEIAGVPGISLLAAGTDGSDGPTDAAGAFADSGTVARAASAQLDAARFLERNDSYRFFEAEGGLLRTGPTRTNVMDLALWLVRPAV